MIIHNTKDEGTVYVALKPTQVKSALGNSGKFDPKNPDINLAAWDETLHPRDHGRFADKEGSDASGDASSRFVDYQSKPGYKSREIVVRMPIRDFLDMAEQGHDAEKAARVAQMLQDGKKFELPTLRFERRGDDATVMGHEGRHRAKVLLEHGYQTMPVRLEGDIRWSEQDNAKNFDYVKKWPGRLLGQSGRMTSIPFPVSRGQNLDLAWDETLHPRAHDGRFGEKEGDGAKVASSPAFKAWFAGSKVVDADGKPRVMYHTTAASFSEFKTHNDGGFGSHFGTLGQANDIAERNPGVATNVMPVYLAIKNPIRLPDLGTWQDLDVLKSAKLDRAEWIKRVQAQSSADPYNWKSPTEIIRGMLREKGYDGIVYANTFEGGHRGEDSYVAFEPTQIKSALGNSGKFDPKNPDINLAAWDESEHPRGEGGRFAVYQGVHDEKASTPYAAMTPDIAQHYARRAGGTLVRRLVYDPKHALDIRGPEAMTPDEFLTTLYHAGVIKGLSPRLKNELPMLGELGKGRADEAVATWRYLEQPGVKDALQKAGFKSVRFTDRASNTGYDLPSAQSHEAILDIGGSLKPSRADLSAFLLSQRFELEAVWTEALHPRASDGKFATSEGERVPRSEYADKPRVFKSKDDITQIDDWGEKKWVFKARTYELLTGDPLAKSDLPETLYHVTTAAPAVEQSGVLLGQRAGGGMGGGQDDGVSFTSSESDAKLIQRELSRAVRIARGDDTIADFERMVREDEKVGGLKEGALDEAMARGRVMWDSNIGHKTYKDDADGSKHSSLMQDTYNSYLWARESVARGNDALKNPLLMGDRDKLAKMDPSAVQILSVPSKNIPDAALITTGSDKFLHEVRAYSDVPVQGATRMHLAWDEAAHPRAKDGRFGEKDEAARHKFAHGAAALSPPAESRLLGAAAARPFWHGTSDEALKHIMKEGLVPHAGHGGDDWLRQIGMTAVAKKMDCGKRHLSVYMTHDESEAENFAVIASRATGGKPVMLEIHVPVDQMGKVKGDEQDMLANRFEGKIPPSWIKPVLGFKPSAHAVATVNNIERSIHAADAFTKVIYAVFIVKDDGEAEDAADATNLAEQWDESLHPRDHGRFATKEEDRDDAVARYKSLVAEMGALAKVTGGNMTAAQGRAYEKLHGQVASIAFDLAKPLTADKVLPAKKRESTLSPEVVIAAQHDLLRDKAVYMAITTAAAGSHFNAETPVDRIVNGKDATVSPDVFRRTFDATRTALRAQYGDTVPAFRAEGKQKDKATQNWATTREFAQHFGKNIVQRDVTVDSVLAVNVGLKGTYHELIVDTRRGVHLAATWDEARHPRASNGRFGEKGQDAVGADVGRGTLDSPARVWRAVRGSGFDPRTPRPGYGFTSYTTSQHVANTFTETDVAKPFTIAAKRVIEFPVRKSKISAGNDFDKFAFDRAAANLKPGEALVARQVYDRGAWGTKARDPQRLSTYPSDIFAVKDPSVVAVGHGEANLSWDEALHPRASDGRFGDKGAAALPDSVKGTIFAEGLDPAQYHAHAEKLMCALDDAHKDDPMWEQNVVAVREAMANFPMIHTAQLGNIETIGKVGLHPAHEFGAGFTFDKISGLDRTVFMRMGQAGGGGHGAVGVMIDPTKLDQDKFIITKLGAMDLKAQEEAMLRTPGDHSALVDEQLKPYRETTIGYKDLADVQSRLLVNGYEKDHPDERGKPIPPEKIVSNDHGEMEVKYAGVIPPEALIAYFAGDQKLPQFGDKSAYDYLKGKVPDEKLVKYAGEGLHELSAAYRAHYAAKAATTHLSVLDETRWLLTQKTRNKTTSLSLDWEEDAHPRDDRGRFADRAFVSTDQRSGVIDQHDIEVLNGVLAGGLLPGLDKDPTAYEWNPSAHGGYGAKGSYSSTELLVARERVKSDVAMALGNRLEGHPEMPDFARDFAEDISSSRTQFYSRERYWREFMRNGYGALGLYGEQADKDGEALRDAMNEVGKAWEKDHPRPSYDVARGLRFEWSDVKNEAVMSNPDLRSQFDPALDRWLKIVHPEVRADQLVPDPTEAQCVASMLVSKWAQTSSDDDALSVAIQSAAQEEFKIDSSRNAMHRVESGEVAADVETLTSNYGGLLRAFARAQYDETQAFFKSKGISSVTVFRGMRLRDAEDDEARAAEHGAFGDVQLQPISSFS